MAKNWRIEQPRKRASSVRGGAQRRWREKQSQRRNGKEMAKNEMKAAWQNNGVPAKSAIGEGNIVAKGAWRQWRISISNSVAKIGGRIWRKRKYGGVASAAKSENKASAKTQQQQSGGMAKSPEKRK